MNRTTPAVAVTFAAILLAGCGGDGDAANTTRSTPPSSTPTTAVTSATTTTTTSTSSTTTSTTMLTVTTTSTIPVPSTGGPVDNEDWVVIIQALLTTRDALNAAPDPSRAGEVYFPGSEPWQILQNQLSNKQRDGQHDVDVDPTTVVSAERTFYGPDTGTGFENAIVKVTLHVGPKFGRIVDASGNTIYEIVPDPQPPADGIIAGQFGLVRAKGGSWLIGTQSRL